MRRIKLFSMFLIIVFFVTSISIMPGSRNFIQLGCNAYGAYVWNSEISMPEYICNHAQSTLQDGKVLVTGGFDRNNNRINKAYIYNPSTKTWGSAANMPEINASHAQSTLPDGRVLVTGGYRGSDYSNKVSIYTPSTNTWSSFASMPVVKCGHGQSTLQNGRIFVTGGCDGSGVPNNTAYLYNYEWYSAASMPEAKLGHGQSILPDGRVVVTGGYNGSGYTNKVYIYTPSTNTWSSAANMPEAKYYHAQSTLPDGRVLVTGGYNGSGNTNTAYIYDPSTNTWSSEASMPQIKSRHAQSTLSDGRVLVTGGFDGSSNTNIVYNCTYNNAPTHTITSPSQNSTFCETDTAVIPQISVSDADNDTLTCKYYVDDESAPRDTKTSINTTTAQIVNFNALNMNALADGSHTIKFEVSDGKATPVISSTTFTVDKTPPEIGPVTLTSAINQITVTGSATDSIGGLSPNPYRYDIGTGPTAWTSAASNSFDNLTPNTQYSVTFSAIDNKNHIATTSQAIYTKAQVPIPSVGNPSSYMLDIKTSMNDHNPPSTEYQISVNNGAQYVTPEGALTSSPVWTTLEDRAKTVKGLNPNTTYSFTMKARNAVNIETAASSAVSGTTLAAPPGSPVINSATATSNKITLIWETVTGATKYEVEVNGVSIVNNDLLTTFVHTGLGPGTQNTYRVRANIVTADGTVIGAWSAPVTKNTLMSAPSTPSNVNAAANNTSIIVTWDPSPGATTYQIKVDGVNSNTFSGTNYVHSGLIPGTMHSYQVKSYNSGDESAWSEEIRVTALTDKPVIPANIHVVPGKTQIVLSWNGIAGETYEVEADGVVHNTSSTPSFTHNNLVPGTQHTYRVRSNRTGILSDWCAAVSASTSADVFGVPSNFSADVSDNMVELSWDAVAEATSYEVEVDGTVIDNDNITSCMHLGLVPGSQHVYKARAMKTDQASNWTESLAITTFLLSTPEDLAGTTSQTSITLSWGPVNNAGGYELEMDGAATKGITDTAYTYNGLVPNSQHIFRVRAVNQDGTSAWSKILTKSTQISSYSKPDLTAVNKKTSIIIMWNEIDGATGYDIDIDGTVYPNIANRKFVHSNLTPGALYIYKVKAKKGQEVTDWSDELPVKTLPNGPVVPTNIEASATTDKVLITWDSVLNASEYEIEIDGQMLNIGTGTSYMHLGLLPDTQHTYKIRSKNNTEYSEWSTPLIIKTKNSTQTFTLDSDLDETFGMVFTASNLENPSLYTFTVTYDASQLNVIDLCASTSRPDLTADKVIGTDIQIVQYSPGTIMFRKISTGISGQSWSGTVNSIKFKSKISGHPIVQYTVN